MISRRPKHLFLAIFLLFFLTPFPARAETLPNAGFAPAGLWFSKEPFFEGDKIRIYTALYNSRKEHLSGSVVFRNTGEKIGEAPFSLQSGSAQNVWTEWTAEGGEAKISVEIENAAILEGGASRPVSLEKQKDESVRFVDKDTDKDGVGNLEDEDDDGDGLSDKAELAGGTNPLSADSDKDGIPDKEDKNPLLADEAKNMEPESLFENFSENVPEAVSASGEIILNKVEELRKNQVVYSQNKINEIKTLLEEDGGNEAGTANGANNDGEAPGEGYFENLLSAAALYGLDMETTLRYLSLAFHYMNLYIFKWQIVFYAVILLGVYYLVRRLWRINRGDSF